MGQNEPMSDNEGILHPPQISRTGASSSDAVLSHSQGTHLWEEGFIPLQLAYVQSCWQNISERSGRIGSKSRINDSNKRKSFRKKILKIKMNKKVYQSQILSMRKLSKQSQFSTVYLICRFKSKKRNNTILNT